MVSGVLLDTKAHFKLACSESDDAAAVLCSMNYTSINQR